MAEKINGWTISQNSGKWQAVNSEGTIGIQNSEREVVTKFAKNTEPKNYMKR